MPEKPRLFTERLHELNKAYLGPKIKVSYERELARKLSNPKLHDVLEQKMRATSSVVYNIEELLDKKIPEHVKSELIKKEILNSLVARVNFNVTYDKYKLVATLEEKKYYDLVAKYLFNIILGILKRGGTRMPGPTPTPIPMPTQKPKPFVVTPKPIPKPEVRSALKPEPTPEVKREERRSAPAIIIRKEDVHRDFVKALDELVKEGKINKEEAEQKAKNLQKVLNSLDNDNVQNAVRYGEQVIIALRKRPIVKQKYPELNASTKRTVIDPRATTSRIANYPEQKVNEPIGEHEQIVLRSEHQAQLERMRETAERLKQQALQKQEQEKRAEELLKPIPGEVEVEIDPKTGRVTPKRLVTDTHKPVELDLQPEGSLTVKRNPKIERLEINRSYSPEPITLSGEELKFNPIVEELKRLSNNRLDANADNSNRDLITEYRFLINAFRAKKITFRQVMEELNNLIRIANERAVAKKSEPPKKIVEPRVAQEFPTPKLRSKTEIEQELLKQINEVGLRFEFRDGKRILVDSFRQKVADEKDLPQLIDYFYEIEKLTNGQINLRKFVIRDNIQSFIELLKEHDIKNFLPIRNEKLENANYFIGPTLPNADGRNYCLIYVTANGETKPVVYYRSKSTVGWRLVALRGSSGNVEEEYLNKSNQGEEALALPWELQKILDSKDYPVGDKDIKAKYFAPFINDVYLEIPDLVRSRKYSKAAIILDFNAYERVEQDINASVFADQQKRPIIKLDSETSPNFSKVLSVWESDSALYGQIKKVAIESNDGKLVWVFNVTPEGSYVNTVQIKEHDVSRYGCASVPEFFSEFDEFMLTNPLKEYHVQTLNKLANAIVAMELKSNSARFTDRPIFVKQLGLFKATLKAHAEELASKLTLEFNNYLVKKYSKQFSTTNPAEIIEKYTLFIVQEFSAAKKSKDNVKFEAIKKQFAAFKKEIKDNLKTSFDTYSPELKTLTSHPFLADIQDPLRRIVNNEPVVERKDGSVGLTARQKFEAEKAQKQREDAQKQKEAAVRNVAVEREAARVKARENEIAAQQQAAAEVERKAQVTPKGQSVGITSAQEAAAEKARLGKVEADSFFERILNHFEKSSQERKEQSELSLEKRIQKVFSRVYGSTGANLSLVDILDKPIDFEKLKQIKNPKAKAIIELLEFGLKSGYLDVDAVKLFLEAFDKLDWMSEASIYANLTNNGRIVDAKTQTEYITSLDEFARSNSGKTKDGFMQFNLPKDNNSINTRVYLSLNPKGDPKRLFSALVEALESSGLKDKLYFKCSRDLSRAEQVVFYLTEGIDAKTFESFLLELVHKLGPENLSKEPMLTGIELIPGLYLTEELNKIQITPRRASYNETISALIQMSIDIAIAKHPEILETRDQQLLRKYASKYFEQFCFMCGLDPKTMLEHDNVFANTLLQSFKSGEFTKKLKERTESKKVEPVRPTTPTVGITGAEKQAKAQVDARAQAPAKGQGVGITAREEEARKAKEELEDLNPQDLLTMNIIRLQEKSEKIVDNIVNGKVSLEFAKKILELKNTILSKTLWSTIINKDKYRFEQIEPIVKELTDSISNEEGYYVCDLLIVKYNKFPDYVFNKFIDLLTIDFPSRLFLEILDYAKKFDLLGNLPEGRKTKLISILKESKKNLSGNLSPQQISELRTVNQYLEELVPKEAEVSKPKPAKVEPEPIRVEPQPIRSELPQEERELIQHTLARLKEITGIEFSLTLPEMVNLARTAKKNSMFENTTSLEIRAGEIGLMNWNTNGPILKIVLTKQHRESIFVITDKAVYEHKKGRLWGNTNITHEYNPFNQDKILGLAFVDKDLKLTTYSFGDVPKDENKEVKPEPPKVDSPKGPEPPKSIPSGTQIKPGEPKVVSPTQQRPKIRLLKDVEPIQEQEYGEIKTKSDVRRFVEEPLVAACELFFDLNIQTMTSSANKNHKEGWDAYLGLRVSSLSPENLAIAKRLGGQLGTGGHGRGSIVFSIPVTGEETVEEISNKFLAIAKQFKKQEPQKSGLVRLEEPKVEPVRVEPEVVSPAKTHEKLVLELVQNLSGDIRQMINEILRIRKVEFVTNPLNNGLIEIEKDSETGNYFVPEGLLTKRKLVLEEGALYVVGRSGNNLKVSADGTVDNILEVSSSSYLLNERYSRFHGLFILTKEGLVFLKLGQNDIKISRKVNESFDEQVTRTVQEPEPKVEIPAPVVESTRAESKTPVDERREFLIGRLKNAKKRFKDIEYKLKNTEPELVADPEENDLIQIDKNENDYYLPKGIISDKEFNLKKNVLYVIGRTELTEIDAKGNANTIKIDPPLERTVSREHGMFILTDKGLVMWRYGRYAKEVKTEEGRDLLKIVPRDFDERSPIELIINFIDALPENIGPAIKTVLKEREVKLSENPLGNDLIELEQDPKTKKYFVPAGVLTPEPLILDKNKLYVFGRTGVFSIDELANRIDYQNMLFSQQYSRVHGLFMLTEKGLICVNVGANGDLKASREQIAKLKEEEKKKKEEIKPESK